MTDDPQILGVSAGRTHLDPASPTDRAFVDSWRYRSDAPARDGDYELLEGWLSRIRYKPDTRFTVAHEPFWGGYAITIERRLADSTRVISTLSEFLDPRNAVTVAARLEVPPYYLRTKDFDAFWRWLYHEIFGMEKHEMNEWFHVDAELPFDPHKER